MNGYNFTIQVRESLGFAREEAAALNHEYVGAEHLLLGLLRVEDTATTMLQNLSVELDELRADILERTKRGTNRNVGPDLPYTSRAKKCLEFAMTEARDLNHNYVGTGHLLLGVLREENGIAAQALVAAGVTLETAREEMVRVLGHGTAVTEGIKVKFPPGSVRAEFWHSVPEPFGSVMGYAHGIAKARGDNEATIADMLEAVIMSSPVVAAAFTSREIEIDKLIADVRSGE